MQRVERVVAIMMQVELLSADWDLARERPNAVEWLSMCVWVVLAPYAPLVDAGDPGDAGDGERGHMPTHWRAPLSRHVSKFHTNVPTH